MEKELERLGLNEKEVKVYLYLIEYGVSAASEIAKYLQIPKSTINFLADNLWKKGFIQKSYRGKTGYYEADISLLEKTISDELLQKKESLKNLIPVLKEKNRNIISKPKISFIDGVENCKKAYQELLEEDRFYEFGAHKDLEQAFGEEFMENFIQKRVEKNIFCDSIGSDGKVEVALQKLDKEHNRSLKIFKEGDYGNIASSIAIYNNKVLILNLKGVHTGVLIENKELSETMKTIFLICKR